MTTSSMNRRARRWRRFVGGLCAVSLSLQMGCYTYKPLQTSIPATGERIAVLLNDRGRFVLGDRLGSAVDKVDGLLVGADSLNVTLEVYRTTDLRGNVASWAGERVPVPRDAITGYQERDFSKRRTWLVVGVTVGAVLVTMLMVNLNVLGGPSHSDPGSGTSGQSR
jgi:hypothetical protein